MFSSSTTDRLVKLAFGRRGVEQFLNVCLLQKPYMKTLESSTDEDEDVSSAVVNQILDRVCAGEEEDEDDLDLAARIAKRALVTDETRQIKRFRSLDV